MSVILEFTIKSDEFSLGRVLTAESDLQVSLEAIVPTGDKIFPFFWVDSAEDTFADFEERVRAHPMVRQLTRLDRLDNMSLYSATWETKPESVVSGLTASDGAILTARGTREMWTFTTRFVDHTDLETFQSYLRDHDIHIDIDLITDLTKDERSGFFVDLTDDQREAIVFAVSEGYFEVPRRVDLEEIAEEFQITRQAASELIRRAEKEILRTVLLES